ncbi:MAG: V-type ATP synthase subunit E [Planctomycetota bacterium]|jgi:vacuolar-type H+-ATPase subunit E/Vma4
MALQDILLAIRRDSDAEAERLDSQADGEADALLAGARKEAQALKARAAAARASETAAAAARVRNRAALEAGRLVRQAREDVYQRALGRLRETLGQVRGRDDYALVLDALVAEARRALPDASETLCDPRDEHVLTPTTCRLKTTLATWGGVTLASDDGRSVVNTLERRLERAEPELRCLASRRIET